MREAGSQVGQGHVEGFVRFVRCVVQDGYGEIPGCAVSLLAVHVGLAEVACDKGRGRRRSRVVVVLGRADIGSGQCHREGEVSLRRRVQCGCEDCPQDYAPGVLGHFNRGLFPLQRYGYVVRQRCACLCVRPFSIPRGVDCPHLYVVLRRVCEIGDDVSKVAASPGVVPHRPVGVHSLVFRGIGLDVAHIVGGDSPTAVIGWSSPHHGQRPIATSD